MSFDNLRLWTQYDPVNSCQEVMSWTTPWTLMRRKKRMWRTWSKPGEVSKTSWTPLRVIEQTIIRYTMCIYKYRLWMFRQSDYNVYIHLLYIATWLYYTHMALQMQPTTIWPYRFPPNFFQGNRAKWSPAVTNIRHWLKNHNLHSENDSPFPLLLDSLWAFRIFLRHRELHRRKVRNLSNFELSSAPAISHWSATPPFIYVLAYFLPLNNTILKFKTSMEHTVVCG